MQYEKLLELEKKVKTRNPQAVMNYIRPSQKYLLISSDPSSETDKSKGEDEAHSSFEERVIALFFFGSDSKESLAKFNDKYPKFRKRFFDNVYWTHYSKVYAKGNPDNSWSEFLKKEIELSEPELIIIFGNPAAMFLLGKGTLKDRVNRILNWRGISVICCLHPSKDWNLKKRPDFQFDDTWKLIRSKIDFIHKRD